MTSKTEIKQKFWKALKSDMTVMLGLSSDGGHSRPMTANFEGESGGPIWFFSSTESEIVQQTKGTKKAVMTFVSKGHDLFAAAEGTLTIDNDRAVIDRLWNRFVAAWYEKGKDDPKLALLRFDPADAEIWIDASSMVAGIKMLIGIDPKEDFKDKVASVKLG